MCMCVYDSNTFFYKEKTHDRGVYFVTHFSICHSFLDSYIKGEFGAKSQGGKFGGKIAQDNQGAQSHSRTVAQYPKPTAQVEVIPFVILAYGSSRGHLRGHMSQSSPPTHIAPTRNHENCPALHFALCCKKIEMEFAHKSKYS